MSEYSTHNSSDAFVDFPEPLMHLNVPYRGKLPEGQVLCAQCKGHGGWNLRLNAYPRTKDQKEHIQENRALHGLEALSDQEFRHLYEHFRACCSNCNGWGYVDASQGDHIHTWKELSRDECRKKGLTHFGMCYHVYKCETCAETMATDSSD